MKPRVIVTGTAGLIGQYFVKTAARWASGWEVHGLTRADLDLTDFSSVERMWERLQPNAVIHCAALSRTKDCERDPQQARRINVEATAYLAGCSKEIPFVFLSSGEVFDGQGGWYRETDHANPINVYGQTKLEAEHRVLQNPRHTVVRIVLTAGISLNGDRSFVEDMRRAATSDRAMTLYGDEFRCPLPAGVIPRAVWELVNREATGLYHLGGRDRLSRWEIGQALLACYPELQGHLFEGSSTSHTGAPRPRDLSLNCDKLQALLSFPIPGFREWLRDRMQQEGDLWDYESTLA
ncbi:MAG: SDR family oxidoreductase [Nitrospira sp.]|nr:SDR family oxidoreductase [Nitrospira sp.]